MEFLTFFFKGLLMENLFVFHAIGLGMLAIFHYTVSESLWVSLRIICLLMLQVFCLILVYPFFNAPGKEVFLILFLLGTEILLTIIINKILPYSRLEKGVLGMTKRGDSILPITLAVILMKEFSAIETIAYSLGLSIGFSLSLIGFTTISVKFSFHRLSSTKAYALKFFILGVLAIFFG